GLWKRQRAVSVFPRRRKSQAALSSRADLVWSSLWSRTSRSTCISFRRTGGNGRKSAPIFRRSRRAFMILRSPLQRRIQSRLDQFVRSGAAPGAQLALGYKDRCIGLFSSGYRDLKRRHPVRQSTLFDLSSLTKI